MTPRQEAHGEGGAPAAQHDPITVIVNGRPREVDHRLLSFDDVVRLAFDPVPTGPNVLLTVSFRNAAGERKGTLTEGESIEVKEHGTVFNVTATDKS
ncbi:MAG: multiubiquitin domain-containing protein [Actinomycetota bacterium]|jgi:hypothetical protein|nr:multiubiquitin domain-containing protein [Actinomycetota bacterium]